MDHWFRVRNRRQIPVVWRKFSCLFLEKFNNPLISGIMKLGQIKKFVKLRPEIRKSFETFETFAKKLVLTLTPFYKGLLSADGRFRIFCGCTRTS